MYLNHYTDANAINGILSPEGLKIRATRFSHLNDSMEVKWISEKLMQKKESMSAQLGLTYDPDSKVYPYVICFCDLEDELLMWKLYGRDCKGFMLSLDSDVVSKFAKNPHGNKTNPDILQGITYADENDWERKFKYAYDIYRQEYGGDNSSDLDEVAALIKRDIYSHENETRYMRPAYDTVSFRNGEETYDGEEYKDLKFRSGEYGVIPYCEIILPKEALKKIIVGSEYDFECQKAALQLLMKKNGYENVKIEKSQVIK